MAFILDYNDGLLILEDNILDDDIRNKTKRLIKGRQVFKADVSGHAVTIVKLQDLPLSKSRLAVSCNCAFHKFQCEYALTSLGASWIKYSNGQPPNFTNPDLAPIVCKHVYALLDHISRKSDGRIKNRSTNTSR